MVNSQLVKQDCIVDYLESSLAKSESNSDSLESMPDSMDCSSDLMGNKSATLVNMSSIQVYWSPGCTSARRESMTATKGCMMDYISDSMVNMPDSTESTTAMLDCSLATSDYSLDSLASKKD
jgi:hypothetical protein